MSKDYRIYWFLLAASVLVIVLELYLVLSATRHGLDLTDEGYALLWIRQPNDYRFTITHFGMVYHPFFAMLGGNVVLLRVLNLGTSVGLAFVLFWQIFSHSEPRQSDLSRVALMVVVVSAALSALSYTQLWLPTPNYNWLTLQGQLVCCIGMLQCDDKETDISALVMSAFLVGFGGWLVFMAKPPNSIATGFLIALTWVYGYNHPFRRVAIALFVFLAMLLLTAIAHNGSVSEFVLHLIDSNEFSRRLRQNDSWSLIWRRDPLIWTQIERNVFYVLIISSFTISSLLLHKAKFYLIFALLVLISYVFGVSESMIFNGQYKRSLMQGLWIYAPPIGNVIAIGINIIIYGIKKQIQKSNILSFCLLFFMPFAYSMASGNNFWAQSGGSGVFILAAVSIIIGILVPVETRGLLFLWNSLSSLMVTLVLTSIGINDPYRQSQTLFSQNIVQQSLPLITAETADYIRRIGEALRVYPRGPRKILLDMTGFNPGLSFAIGAEALGQPWLLGGYPGSADFARAALYDTPCSDLASAFVLLAPEGKRKLPDDTFEVYGLQLENNYTKIAAANYPVSREKILLMAPIHSNQIEEKCLAQRKSVPVEKILTEIPKGGILDQALQSLKVLLQ